MAWVVDQKYLEDENNNIISPVASTNSVYIRGYQLK